MVIYYYYYYLPHRGTTTTTTTTSTTELLVLFQPIYLGKEWDVPIIIIKNTQYVPNDIPPKILYSVIDEIYVAMLNKPYFIVIIGTPLYFFPLKVF